MVSISKQDVTQLKELVLQAIFDQKPLPGSNKPLFFPDLPFILSQQTDLYVFDEQIDTPIHLDNQTVQVVTRAYLNRIADSLKKVIYFQFQKISMENDTVSLSLDAKVLTAPGSRILNLSHMQLKFQKVQSEWKVFDEPSYLSS